MSHLSANFKFNTVCYWNDFDDHYLYFILIGLVITKLKANSKIKVSIMITHL